MAKLSSVFLILLHMVFLENIPTSTGQVYQPPRTLHPSQISTITLVAGALTTSGSVLSLPLKQIQCIGSYCHAAQVLHATCQNAGFDGHDIQWKCKYTMEPPGYKVSFYTVNCEGFGDVLLVEGSCSFQYSVASSFEMGDTFVVLIVIIVLVLFVAAGGSIYGPPHYGYTYGGYGGYGTGGVTTGIAFGGTTRRTCGGSTGGGSTGGVSTGTAFGGTTRR